jgi:hypothetical protein
LPPNSQVRSLWLLSSVITTHRPPDVTLIAIKKRASLLRVERTKLFVVLGIPLPAEGAAGIRGRRKAAAAIDDDTPKARKKRAPAVKHEDDEDEIQDDMLEDTPKSTPKREREVEEFEHIAVSPKVARVDSVSRAAAEVKEEEEEDEEVF